MHVAHPPVQTPAPKSSLEGSARLTRELEQPQARHQLVERLANRTVQERARSTFEASQLPLAFLARREKLVEPLALAAAAKGGACLVERFVGGRALHHHILPAVEALAHVAVRERLHRFPSLAQQLRARCELVPHLALLAEEEGASGELELGELGQVLSPRFDERVHALPKATIAEACDGCAKPSERGGALKHERNPAVPALLEATVHEGLDSAPFTLGLAQAVGHAIFPRLEPADIRSPAEKLICNANDPTLHVIDDGCDAQMAACRRVTVMEWDACCR